MAQWYVNRSGQAEGPFDEGDLIAGIHRREVLPAHWVCPAGSQEWQPLDRYPPFAEALAGTSAGVAPANAALPPKKSRAGLVLGCGGLGLLGVICGLGVALSSGLFGGKTDDECRASGSCSGSGLCFADEDGERCIAREDADCAASRSCVANGNCTLGGTRCAPATEAHCLDSEQCAEEGECALNDQLYTDGGLACSPGSPEHCRDSRACQSPEAGRPALCRYHPRRRRCLVRGALVCVESSECTVEGRCTETEYAPDLNAPWSTSYRCSARTDEDCQLSRVCRRDGLCLAQAGECVQGGEAPAGSQTTAETPADDGPGTQESPEDAQLRAFILRQTARIEQALSSGTISAEWGWSDDNRQDALEMYRGASSHPVFSRQLVLTFVKENSAPLVFKVGLSASGELRFEGGAALDRRSTVTYVADMERMAPEIVALEQRIRDGVMEDGCRGLPWVAEGDERAPAVLHEVTNFLEDCSEIQRRLGHGYQLSRSYVLSWSAGPLHYQYGSVAVMLGEGNNPPLRYHSTYRSQQLH